MRIITCTPKIISPEQADRALRRSLEMDPRKAASIRTLERTPAGRRGGPRRLAVVIDTKWPETGVKLSVQFLDNPPEELRKRILLHMNAWNKTANVHFTETKGTGLVRIARVKDDGHWSYLGTQILGIEDDEQTMNLDGFTIRTPESEFLRVVRHEAGHTLGFDHEHLRTEFVKKIDRKKAIAFYDKDQGWTAEETIEQVLMPLAKKSIIGTTEADPLSIMCYEIPAEITKDGKAIRGGDDINEKDYAFAASIYPKRTERTKPAEARTAIVPVNASPNRVPSSVSDTFSLVILDELPSEEKNTKGKKVRSKYARILASYAGARVTSPVRLRADDGEEPTSFGKIIRMHERIKNYTNESKGTLPSEADLIAFGSDLFDALFQGDVRRLYDEARARQQNSKLDMVFTSMIPWIAEKPWEFAYDRVRKSFLATEDVHLIRNVMTAIPASVITPQQGPLRILVASAQPVGFGRLSIDQETEMIRRGFEQLISDGLVQVDTLTRATPEQIHGRLSTEKYNVVHFIGHGVFNEAEQQGELVFENERGTETRLDERQVREIFCKRGVQLVFLNACQSGSGGRADFNKGVAQSLVSHGLPALVANQYSVLDSSATSFAQHFYWALAQGMSVGQAACEARIAVNYSLQGEVIDWAVPVVYARDPSMTLCAPPATISTMPPRAAAIARRSSRGDRAVRVAVWDIDNVFPRIDGTLERLNNAQGVFSFDRVDLSAPIDAWDNSRRGPDGKPYLDAVKLAQRLGHMPAELSVDILACATRHWMRDADTLNLYGWWPDDKKPAVMIFSAAGFEKMPVEGAVTDRVIANLLVTGLTGFLSDMGTHPKGAKDCPMWSNTDREFAHIAGAQTFDKSCRAKLIKKMKEEFEALDVLLKTFH